MAILNQAVTVTTSATRLDSTTEVQAVSQCMVRNFGTDYVYLGGSGVTAAAGFPLAAGEAATVDLGRNEGLFGITSTGSQAVRVLEVGAS